MIFLTSLFISYLRRSLAHSTFKPGYSSYGGCSLPDVRKKAKRDRLKAGNLLKTDIPEVFHGNEPVGATGLEPDGQGAADQPATHCGINNQVEPLTGLEPATHALRKRCSTN